MSAWESGQRAVDTRRVRQVLWLWKMAWRDSRGGRKRLLLAIAAMLVILLADLSGLSKAEAERIWLPFTVWLLPAGSLLPSGSRRTWLTVQAVTALAVNHLVLTFW